MQPRSVLIISLAHACAHTESAVKNILRRERAGNGE